MDHGLELVVGEGLDLAAVVADEVVVVVLAASERRLVAGDAGDDVDPLQETALGELLENAVDDGDADAPVPAPEAVSLLALIAAATLIAVRGLGNLLVVAVLVAPAATARLLTNRLSSMMLVAAAVAVACDAGGLYLSY